MKAYLDSILEGVARLRALPPLALSEEQTLNHIRHIDDMIWSLLDAVQERITVAETEKEKSP